MTTYETVSAGSKGAANLLEHQYKGTTSDLGSWLSAQSVKNFTIGPYKLLMKKVMKSLSIGYVFHITQHSSGLVVTTTLPELNCGEI